MTNPHQKQPTTQVTPLSLFTERMNTAISLEEQGEHREITVLLRQAIADAAGEPSITPFLMQRVLGRQANALVKLGEWNEAVEVQRAYVQLLTIVHAGETEPVLRATDVLRSILHRAGERAQATEVADELITKRVALQGPSHPDTLLLRMRRALYAFDAGEFEEAAEMYREIDANHLEATGEHHPKALAYRMSSAVEIHKAGDSLAAIPILREILEWRERTLGEDDPGTRNALEWLLAALLGQSMWAESVEPRRRLIAIRERAGESVSHDRLMLGYAFRNSGRYAEAAAAFSLLVDEHTAADGPFSRATLSARYARAGATSASGQRKPALEELAEVLDLVREYHPEDEDLLASVLMALGIALLGARRVHPAELAFRQAYAFSSRAVGAEAPRALDMLELLTTALHRQNKYGELALTAATLVAAGEKLFADTRPEQIMARERLAVAYEKTGKPELAKAQRVRVAAARKTIAGQLTPGSRESCAAHQDYVEALRMADEPRQAVEEADRLLELLSTVSWNAQHAARAARDSRLRSIEAIGVTDEIVAARRAIAANSGRDFEAGKSELTRAMTLGKVYVEDLSYAGQHSEAVSVASVLVTRAEAAAEGPAGRSRLKQAREILAAAYEQQGSIEQAVQLLLLVSAESAGQKGMDVEETLLALKKAQTLAARIGDPASVLKKFAGTVGAGVGKELLESTALELLEGKLPDLDTYLSSFDITSLDGLDSVTGIAVEAISGVFSI